jgi:hypothetical protein
VRSTDERGRKTEVFLGQREGRPMEFELRGAYSKLGMLRVGDHLDLSTFAPCAQGLRGIISATTTGFALDDIAGWAIIKGEIP